MTNRFVMEKSLKHASPDYTLLGLFALITGIGLANLYSASYGYALSLNRVPEYFINRQLMWLLFGTIILLICTFISLDFIKKMMPAIVLGSLLLLSLPFIPGLGVEINGARRWIGFNNLSLQPSEFFKPVLILYLAYVLSKKADRLDDVVNAVLPPLLVIVAGIAIVLYQTDFSTAMLLSILAIIMLWIAKVPLVFFLAFASIAIPGIALLILTSRYRLERVLGFIAPNFDPSDISYQVNGSIQAIKAGGFWGKGIGQGTLKIGSIPEVQSDFVFASLVEESGFVGVLVFFALWAYAVFRMFKMAFAVKDHFQSLLCFGMTSYLSIQVLLNVMVVSGMVPATGIPLPLFSSGGSSLLSIAVALGFVFNVSRTVSYEKNQDKRVDENNSFINSGVQQ